VPSNIDAGRAIAWHELAGERPVRRACCRHGRLVPAGVLAALDVGLPQLDERGGLGERDVVGVDPRDRDLGGGTDRERDPAGLREVGGCEAEVEVQAVAKAGAKAGDRYNYPGTGGSRMRWASTAATPSASVETASSRSSA
jgi:hypothetical protein